MQALISALIILFGSLSSVTAQCALDQDPCRPTLPCVPTTTMSDPTNCRRHQVCLAPYEWAAGRPCLDGMERFDNSSCACRLGADCNTWSCPPLPTEEPTRGNISEPCFYNNDDRSCTVQYMTIPDRYYCTRYYKCYNGEWGLMVCPSDSPYYDPLNAEPGQPVPCSASYFTCSLIDFDSCLDLPTTVVPTPPPTTQHTTVKYTTESRTTEPTTMKGTTSAEDATTAPFTTEPNVITTRRTTDITTEATTTQSLTTQDAIETTTRARLTTTYQTEAPQGPDACSPCVPCTVGERVSYPADCEQFQECVGPYEWVVDDSNCKGSFNNQTGTCNSGDPCHIWTCPDQGTTQPPIQSEPCFVEETVCTEEWTVPDRYYCSKYFQCINSTWVGHDCPENTPFFDVEMSDARMDPPCINNIARCSYIPFSECMDIIIAI